MNAGKIEILNEELLKLEKFGSGVIGSVIVNRNGLLMNSRLPLDIDDRKFGAMAAALFNGMESAAETLKKDKIHHITVEMNDFQIIALSIDEQLILVSLINIDVNFGLVLIELEEFIDKAKIILEG